jgi:hypothetical protein
MNSTRYLTVNSHAELLTTYELTGPYTRVVNPDPKSDPDPGSGTGQVFFQLTISQR